MTLASPATEGAEELMRGTNAVGVLFSVGVSACTVSGARTEQVGQAKEALASTISVSAAVPVEDPIYDNPPYSWYTLASTPNRHLMVMQSPSQVLGGYSAVAFVVRNSTIVNGHGTRLDQPVPFFSPVENAATFSGTRWLIVLGNTLYALNTDGALVSTTALPFDARAIVWGTDRALVVGASSDSPSGSGPNQALFVDAAGRLCGAPFSVVTGSTQLHSGLGFDGSRFLLEYSTLGAVSAVAISTRGDVGTPVELAAEPDDPYGYGDAVGVLSDGHRFLASYLTASDSGLHYRLLRANGHLDINADDERVLDDVSGPVTRGAFIGGRYVFLDYSLQRVAAVATTGKEIGTATSYGPGAGYIGDTLSAAPDGTNPMLLNFDGSFTNLSSKLTPVGSTAQVGLGPDDESSPAAVFNGKDFTLEWADFGRASSRREHVARDGTRATPAVGLGAAVSYGALTSNGSSVLRVNQSQPQAVLTFADDTTTTIDLSPYAVTYGYFAAGSNGTDYVVVSADGTQATAVRLSPTGQVLGSSSFVAGLPLVGYDGERYVVASSQSTYRPQTDTWDIAATFTPLSAADITPGPTVVVPLVTDIQYGIAESFASGDAQSLLVWSQVENDGQRHVYCARVGSDLTLLDVPGVPLGQADINSVPAAVAWDGTTYWVAWTSPGSGAPAIRRVSPEPVGGSILPEADPVVAAGEPMGQAVLASQPGGPTLLFASPAPFGASTWRMLSVK